MNNFFHKLSTGKNTIKHTQNEDSKKLFTGFPQAVKKVIHRLFTGYEKPCIIQKSGEGRNRNNEEPRNPNPLKYRKIKWLLLLIVY